MAQLWKIHPTHPQTRSVRQMAKILGGGGLIVYPTDSSYALGWLAPFKDAQEKVRQLRRLDKHHNFTIICRDLSDFSQYCHLDTWAFRLCKGLTPGPYTFILRASKGVPQRLQNIKSQTIGLRIPEHTFVSRLLDELEAPLLSSTLFLPDEQTPTDPEQIHRRLQNVVDAVIDCGPCPEQPTTVLSLVGDSPEVMRRGRGSTAFLSNDSLDRT